MNTRGSSRRNRRATSHTSARSGSTWEQYGAVCAVTRRSYCVRRGHPRQPRSRRHDFQHRECRKGPVREQFWLAHGALLVARHARRRVRGRAGARVRHVHANRTLVFVSLRGPAGDLVDQHPADGRAPGAEVGAPPVAHVGAGPQSGVRVDRRAVDWSGLRRSRTAGARVDRANASERAHRRAVHGCRRGSNQGAILALPGGEPFTRLMLDLHSRGVKFISIAGNDDVLVTVTTRPNEPVPPAPARVLTTVPVLTTPEDSRYALSVPVASLSDVMTAVLSNGGSVVRIYDY